MDDLDIVSILLDITKKDIVLKNSIIFKYSKGDNEQEIKKCKNLIDSIVTKYTGREGFIKYREVCSILNRYRNIVGDKNQKEMINVLSTLYNKRPAFLDELRKLNR